MKKLGYVLLSLLFVCPVLAEDPNNTILPKPTPIHAYFYPHVLTPQDFLTDGGTVDTSLKISPFKIEDNTLLIWIDQMPTAYFAHPTAYLMISGKETRVVRGEWWPILNGKDILYNEHNQYAILSDFTLNSKHLDGDINVHIYPTLLTPEDELLDGPSERLFRIKDKTLLIWVDLHPDMRYVHPTKYILISAKGIDFIDGDWWPVLNGKSILYGNKNKLAIISPYLIE